MELAGSEARESDSFQSKVNRKNISGFGVCHDFSIHKDRPIGNQQGSHLMNIVQLYPNGKGLDVLHLGATLCRWGTY